MNRRTFLQTAAGAALWNVGTVRGAQAPPPNIVMIYADDLGYGDLGCYGGRIRTPNVNRMAREGALFRHFYSASAVCSPSRAALLTGRYPVRTGVTSVLAANAGTGLPDSETTLAQVLKGAGYKTMCVGKWHLGSLPQYLPTNRGFDEYYGIPYSNDMSPSVLMHNTDIIEQPVRQDTLTRRYTEQALGFIQRSKDAPFFLYLPHTFPHIPLAASPDFRGKSSLGVYGDAVEELDWSTGQVLQALKDNALDQNTLVMFSSDNGPWYEGSAGKLRGRKGQTYEGGMREPFIAWWPGRIPHRGVVHGMATTMDIMPTVTAFCSASLPPRPLDGVNIWPLMTGEREAVQRDAFLYFDSWDLQCARVGRWKLHVARHNTFPWSPEPAGGRLNLPLPKPELYDLDEDPEESYDVADDNPQIVADIRANIDALLPGFPAEVQTAWRETLSRQVWGTAPGALPVLRTTPP
jgi:arylsulfatase A